MRIGILGSGRVGSALARGYLRHGYEVMLGTRDESKPEVRAIVEATGGRIGTGSYAQAARFGDVVFTAYPGRLQKEMVDLIGAENLAGKIVVDVVNPVVRSDGDVRAAFGENDSAAEILQRAVPTARVVKALDLVSPTRMVDPNPAEDSTDMPIAGDDPGAKAEVRRLLESTGWNVRDLGELAQARTLEEQVVTWSRRRAAQHA